MEDEIKLQNFKKGYKLSLVTFFTLISVCLTVGGLVRLNFLKKCTNLEKQIGVLKEEILKLEQANQIIIKDAPLLNGKNHKPQENKSSALLSNDRNLFFPDFIEPEQIEMIIRDDIDINTVHAIAGRPRTFFRGDENFSQATDYEFLGIIKSENGGKDWEVIYETADDIIDLVGCGDKNLNILLVSGSGGGSGELFIKIASSQDEGKNWNITDEIAKNDAEEQYLRQPFIYAMISDLIVEEDKCSNAYVHYKSNMNSKTFDYVVYTDDYWKTWRRKKN